MMNTFEYFEQICKIPRESGNEEGMRQFLLAWAEENKLEAKRDKAGNIIIYCKATEGYENVPGIALQGHMDMVCVKTKDSNHDFTKDPIEVYQDGDFLKAKNTSLGGDNGIAVAMTMALFTDPSVKHGPLEAVFTFSEETGMDGAFALDVSLVKSRKLINIDSEEEGVIYIGCAGGIDLLGDRDFETEKIASNFKTVSVELGGLKGGHSGGEIHWQRVNAISALSRMILALNNEKTDFRIVSFEGGTRKNVIPSSAKCLLAVSDVEKAEKIIEKTYREIKNENKYEEPDFSMIFIQENSGKNICLNEKSSLDFMKVLFAIPHGVLTMSRAVKGVVETSDNLAIVRLENSHAHIEVSVRSLIDSAKYMLTDKIAVILQSFDFVTSSCFEYPSWEPNPDSELAKLCAEVWKKVSGKDAVVTSIHAGLECGVLNSEIPGMDSVSIGPDLFDVHSVNEKLSIGSVKRMYEYLKTLLEVTK